MADEEKTVEIDEITTESLNTAESDNVKQCGDNEPHWYVAHTYSGYENKVKNDIEKTVANQKDLEGQILEVMVPIEEVIEIKNGKKRTIKRKLLPGYVLVYMINNDKTWYVVRNTRGVTGFVGPGSKPVPLTDEEMRRFGIRPETEIEVDVAVGDKVDVVAGAWQGSHGEITEVNKKKQTVTIDTDAFGRTTSVEIDLADIEKM